MDFVYSLTVSYLNALVYKSNHFHAHQQAINISSSATNNKVAMSANQLKALENHQIYSPNLWDVALLESMQK